MKESINIQIGLEEKIKLAGEKQLEADEELAEVQKKYEELQRTTEEDSRHWEAKHN